MKNQFKKADKRGASLAFVLGEDEIKTHTLTIKFLRETRAQITLPWHEVEAFLRNEFE